MCYSAQVRHSYAKYVRAWSADISLREFYRVYWLRGEGSKIRIPKAVDAWFAEPANADERGIKALIDAYDQKQATALEAELFKQKQRLNKAARDLDSKPTKKAAEDQRIATNKIDAAMGRLADLRRDDWQPRDSRIFPGWYAPVVVSEGGGLVVKPMRYQCRPAGKPAFYDTKYPGTYNARRDNLEGFWKVQFGHTHALMIVTTFFENVQRDGKNAVLQFRPEPEQDMLVACLWSRWGGPGEELLSFAAITGDPPAEVAAAGHDRCIVPIKPENVAAWLNPDPSNLAAMNAILDDRERPYYEHRKAA